MRSVGLGSLGLASLVVIVPLSGPANGANRFVATTGVDGTNGCLASTAPCRTIAHAVAQAASGDEVNVAGGTYRDDQVTIDSSISLTLSGGWAPGFSSRDPRANPTTLDGSSVEISAGGGETVDVDLDGLRFTRSFGTLSLNGPIVAQGFADGTIQLTVNNCTFARDPFGNFVAYAGGIVAAHSGSGTVGVVVTRSTFTESHALAGGMSTDAGGTSTINVTVKESTFTKNHADHGGGINFVTNHMGTGSLSVDRSVFADNRALVGGAIAMDTGGSGGISAVVTNSLMFHNRVRGGRPMFNFGGAGGAMDVYGATSLRLVNDTVVFNQAVKSGGGAGTGGGVIVAGGATVDATNVILWGNRTSSGKDDLDVLSGAVLNADHDDVGVQSGPVNDLGGNVSVDPQLAGSFELKSTSPLIDAGTCTGAPPTDIEGDPRPSGAGCDIGADEFQ